MIGMLYSIAIGSQAATAAKALIEVTVPADAVCLIERESITQTSFDTSENLGTRTIDVATGGTGTSTTLHPLQAGFPTSGITAETNATIPPIYGTPVWIESGFNVLSGFLWTPANDDEVIVISPSQLAAMDLDVTPSGSMDLSYSMTVREIGG